MMKLSLPLMLLSCVVPLTAKLPSFDSNTFIFHATPWKICQDYREFQCRNITVPRFYDPTSTTQGISNGSLVNLERRFISGKPKKHIWFLEGGPALSSDNSALILQSLISKALGTDFIFHMPSERGSPHTQSLPDYDTYPANLDEYVRNQTIPLQVYSTTNIAHDIISSVKYEKSRDPTVEHLVIAYSYGTFLLNRILQIVPDLFTTAIFDSVLSPSGVGTTGLQLQGLGLINVAGAISENFTFVDSLAKNVSTPCFDLLAEIAGDGLSKDQLFANLAYGLIFLHNNPVPARLFTNTSINPLDFHAQILEWYRGNHSQPGLITLDNRVLLWALTNHLAQCTSVSEPAFRRLLQQIFLPAINTAAAFQSPLDESMSIIVSDHIDASELDYPLWTATRQRKLQRNSFFRIPDILLDRIEEVRAAHAPFLNPPDQYWRKSATNIRADVIFLNGDLDVNTPIFGAKAAFANIQVAKASSGYTKRFYTIPHAGHGILVNSQSSCTPLFLKAFLGHNIDARNHYDVCLKAESERSLDWTLVGVRSVTGLDIWEGLTV